MSSVVVDPPLLRARSAARQPGPLPAQEDGLPADQVLSLIAGCGLLAYSMWRWSWSSIAVAALGGLLLVYRGLARAA